MDEAIAEYREAIRLKSVEAHNNLGHQLFKKGQFEEAIAEFREAIRLEKNLAGPHNNLGIVLEEKGHSDEAIAEYREAVRLKPDFADYHYSLALALAHKGQVDAAIAEYREAIRLEPDHLKAHNNLGVRLLRAGQFEEAIAEFREALRIKKDDAVAQNNLRDAEQLAALAKRLAAARKGDDHPKDGAERIGFAQLCQLYRKEYVAAIRFYEQAFAAEPMLVASNRYNAACAAALAGCGQGEDADKLDDKEKARLLRQALDWLRADLEANRLLLEKDANKAGAAAVGILRHWLDDPDLASVRGPEALAKLPEAERQPWQKLWNDVADLLKRTQQKK